jgi:hypothetical protein
LNRGGASLDAAARDTVGAFVRSQMNADGGFRGRSAESDLYYTVFGLECARAIALAFPLDDLRKFVEAKAQRPLDFVHLTCLARCLEILWPDHAKPAWGAQLPTRLAAYACAEGGFHRKPGQRRGAVYESFLGMLAGESLGEEWPGLDPFGDVLAGFCQASGGFSNGDGLWSSTTPVTAAALLVLRELKRPLPARALEWLLKRQCARGGFAAAALVPLPDLLSTATALHALNCLGTMDGVKLDACYEFVTGCWGEAGGFHAHALDRTPDCEYTFYALLALGNLVAESAA